MNATVVRMIGCLVGAASVGIGCGGAKERAGAKNAAPTPAGAAARTQTAEPAVDKAAEKRLAEQSLLKLENGPLAGPLDLASASLGQDGTQLQLRITTRGAWGPEQLDPEGSRALCLTLSSGTTKFAL